MKKNGSDFQESNYVSPVSRPPCQALAFLEPLAPEDPTLGGNISNLISISFGEDSLTLHPLKHQRNAAEIANEARCHSQFWVCCTMCVLCWDTLLVLAWGTPPMLGTYLTLVLSLPCYKYRTSHRCCEGLTIRRLIAEENKKEALDGNHFGKMNPFSWCGRPFGVWILTDGPFRPVLYISKDEFTLEAEMSHLYLHLYRSNI